MAADTTHTPPESPTPTLQRLAFETWAREHRKDLDLRYVYDESGQYHYDGYIWGETEDAWCCWQAALAAARPAEQPQEAVGFMVFAEHNGGFVPLPGFCNETEKGVKSLVLEHARKEGYQGTVAGRMFDLGWIVKPVYAAPQPPQQAQAEQQDDGVRYPPVVKRVWAGRGPA